MNETDLIFNWDCNKKVMISFIRKKVKKASDVDDILQEVFIKYWEGNQEIKDKSKVRSWLFSVSNFTIADYYREKKKELADRELFQNEINPDSVFKNTSMDESKKLLPIIYSLPKKYKNIILLCDIYGLPHKTIAEHFNLSLSCVKTRVIRGRKLLGEKMRECCSFTHDKYGNIVSCSEKKTYLECLKNFKKK
jgi:RNA polymerase sigma-70 factor, ECF subfamily